MARNGDIISASSSMREIHFLFGMTCKFCGRLVGNECSRRFLLLYPSQHVYRTDVRLSCSQRFSIWPMSDCRVLTGLLNENETLLYHPDTSLLSSSSAPTLRNEFVPVFINSLSNDTYRWVTLCDARKESEMWAFSMLPRETHYIVTI